ncbi:MAG: hypothetical protein ACYS5V_12795, partial [Planctomycetota bacterium]
MRSESTGMHRNGTGIFRACSGPIVAACVCLFCLAQPARAEITTTGDVQPADPATWTSSTDAYIGEIGSGTLGITNGGYVVNGQGYIGFRSASTGAVTVHGPGSRWTNTASFHIGYGGSGALNITGGGRVLSQTHSYIGYSSGSTGHVTVDGAGSKWTTWRNLHVGHGGSGSLNITNGGEVFVSTDIWVPDYLGSSSAIHFDDGTLTTGDLLCASDDLTGSGTINACGLVSDVDLVFDATHGLIQTFKISDNPGQDITVNLDINSSHGSVSMGAGYGGVGTMSISDGRVIGSDDGYVGFESGSTGVVTVDGAGSRWSVSNLEVGKFGHGTLNITGGGVVRGFNNGNSHIGYKSGSTGVVAVNGGGSAWTDISSLLVGEYGDGTLNITGGGAVSSRDGCIGQQLGSTGVVTVDGAGSTWTSSLDLFVGRQGSGTLRITGGGAVTVEEHTWVSRYSSSSGT